MDTYGHWAKEYSESLPNYSVYNDQCWIKEAKFKLSDMDSLVKVKDLNNLTKLTLEEDLAEYTEAAISTEDAGNYTTDTWTAYQAALKAADGILDKEDTTLDQYYTVLNNLKAAKTSLVSMVDQTKSERESLDGTLEKAQEVGDASQYTSDSWSALQSALANAKAVKEDPASTAAQITAADESLAKAISGLKKAEAAVTTPTTPVNPTTPATEEVKVGGTYPSGNYTYKVTSVTNKTVEVTGIVKDKLSKTTAVTVYNTVKLGSDTYKVTSVAASAFKNNKKITSVTVGKNVETIGKNAFAGCTKLKKVTVKSKKLKQIGAKAFYNAKALKSLTLKTKSLKSVGKNAFKGINKKAVIKVPKAKKKAYTKLLAKKGQSSSVKIK
jgi:hypothetical protein